MYRHFFPWFSKSKICLNKEHFTRFHVIRSTKSHPQSWHQRWFQVKAVEKVLKRKVERLTPKKSLYRKWESYGERKFIIITFYFIYFLYLQKQPFEIGVLKNFAIFTGKNRCSSLFLINTSSGCFCIYFIYSLWRCLLRNTPWFQEQQEKR